MEKKYLIFTPGYSEVSGGVICLHYLADLLSKAGRQAYLMPDFENIEFNIFNKRKSLRALYKGFLRRIRKFKVNPVFNSKIIMRPDELGDIKDWIIIYPEITFGNPVGGKNIVRWLLHNPGFHTGKIYYGPGELYFKYNASIEDFQVQGSHTVKDIFKITRYPLELYNLNGASTRRSGTAYCLRKGRSKKIQHELKDSILIDNMSHAEIAQVFKKVTTFISYDSMTAYASLAALCGCDSVVIPDEGVPEDIWCPDEEDRYGVAYGFENLDKARTTRHLVIERIQRESDKNLAQVKNFIYEAETYFLKRNGSK